MTLAALMQLSSATLPVGAFSYSQGLESAVEAGLVRDEASAAHWIDTVLRHAVASAEAVIVARTFDALEARDGDSLRRINRRGLASRETKELLAETLQMGRSMHVLIADDPAIDAALRGRLQNIQTTEGLCYPLAWAVAAWARGIDVESALVGYLYAALENLTLAAVKIVPLGQSAGQRLLRHLGTELAALANAAVACPLDDLTNFLPRQILACTHHEHQHTRLFRS